MPLRVLIVDDHEMVRAGLRTLLKNAPEIELVGEAESAASSLDAVNRLQPDVVVLDLRLGDGSGIDVCRELKSAYNRVRVLILTSYPDDRIVIEAISAGADGYLLKEAGREMLLSAIKRVGNGHAVLDPLLTGGVFSRIQAQAEKVVANKLLLLSAQEMRVLELVAQGMTNKEVASAIGLSPKTVKNYFSNLLEKLGMNRRTQAAAYYVRQNKGGSSGPLPFQTHS